VPKVPLSSWKVWLRQRLLATVVAVVMLIAFVVLMWNQGETRNERPPRSDELTSDPPIAGVDELWLERLTKDVAAMRADMAQKEKELHERLAKQEAMFLQEKRVLEESLLEMHNVHSKQGEVAMPHKRSMIVVASLPAGSEPNQGVPAGAMAHGVLLSGIEAKAGVSAASDPHPLALLVTSDIILPGDGVLTSAVRCHVMGSGYGDLSSERVYIRLEKMTCQLDDGSVAETSVAGFVVGDDGRCGVRGRVVMRDSKLLVRGFWGGFCLGCRKF